MMAKLSSYMVLSLFVLSVSETPSPLRGCSRRRRTLAPVHRRRTMPVTTSTSTVAPVTTTSTLVPTTTTLVPTSTSSSTTTSRSCEGDVELDFGKAVLTRNNLGGLGPGSGMHGMVFTKLGHYDGIDFDLVIESTKYTASSHYAAINGQVGEFGWFFINRETVAELKFQIVKTGSTIPLTLPSFYFTFFDIDTDVNGMGQEKLSVEGFEKYIVSPNTHLAVSTSNSQTFFDFEGTHLSHGDIPRDPHNLTAQQQNSAVAFHFQNISQFSVVFSSSAGLASTATVADEIMFSGSSQLGHSLCGTSATPTPPPSSTPPATQVTTATAATTTPATTTPVQTSSRKCKQVCTSNSQPWSIKCGWKHCKKCGECKTSSDQGKCKNWCASDKRDWATKCMLRKCKGCGPCDKDRRLQNNVGALPTYESDVLV